MYDELKKMIDDSKNIVFFGGAGVSTESGIPDYRGEGGLYTQSYKYPPETVLSRSFFDARTAEFYEYYFLKLLIRGAQPNKAHFALASLEQQGRLSAVITQNVDNLHQIAGSRNVIELHGTAFHNYCVKCGKTYDIEFMYDAAPNVPLCTACGGVVRPDITLYEEQLHPGVMAKAASAVSAADLLIVAGTSLYVYPAAGIVNRYQNGKVVIINKSPTPGDRNVDLVINAPVGEVLAECVGIL